MVTVAVGFLVVVVVVEIDMEVVVVFVTGAGVVVVGVLSSFDTSRIGSPSYREYMSKLSSKLLDISVVASVGGSGCSIDSVCASLEEQLRCLNR